LKVLVTGGAGYIGSHTVKELLREGHAPIVFDNLSTGHKEAVLCKDFFEGDLQDKYSIQDCFDLYKPDAVLHFAGSCYVGESMEAPAKYYRNNVVSTLNLLDAMKERDIGYITFSSSCTVYDNNLNGSLRENYTRTPNSTYGRSKFFIEEILQDYRRAYGIKSVVLRYFNVAGADPEGVLGEDHTPETHLIPLVLRAGLEKGIVRVFGTDYPTSDGTCVRDYVHVQDLARAHTVAFESLVNRGIEGCINLGSERGYSVREVIDISQKVIKCDIAVLDEGRRDGDLPIHIADIGKARDLLGWEPSADLEMIIETAWAWMKRHPKGYKTVG
jgi:UDP-glucose 4-epimerase